MCSEQLSENHFEKKVTRNWIIYCTSVVVLIVLYFAVEYLYCLHLMFFTFLVKFG